MAILALPDCPVVADASQIARHSEGMRHWLWAAWYPVFGWLTAQVVYIAYQDNFG